ncbi:Hypothetical predicted protein [Olea europaea subsp. europaea]|uniref:Uncharacterized protein n=1 Tax=Olea europaea subsp. europaea TaxID=158383 RepID=A0A8S0RXV9_OLEEU|nr:Hypothetical predicted protein [Olea europaea subsp. europaea]
MASLVLLLSELLRHENLDSLMPLPSSCDQSFAATAGAAAPSSCATKVTSRTSAGDAMKIVYKLDTEQQNTSFLVQGYTRIEAALPLMVYQSSPEITR